MLKNLSERLSRLNHTIETAAPRDIPYGVFLLAGTISFVILSVLFHLIFSPNIWISIVGVAALVLYTGPGRSQRQLSRWYDRGFEAGKATSPTYNIELAGDPTDSKTLAEIKAAQFAQLAANSANNAKSIRIEVDSAKIAEATKQLEQTIKDAVKPAPKSRKPRSGK